jgi:hypothetical protein
MLGQFMDFSLSFVSSVYTGSPEGGTIGEFLEYVEVAPHVGHLVRLLLCKAHTIKGKATHIHECIDYPL